MPHSWNDLRLQHKLVLSLALITALVTGGALAVVQIRVHDQIDRQIGQQVQISLTAFRNFQARSDSLAAAAASLVSAVPSLEAALSTHDARTVQDPAADIHSMLAPGTLLVVAGSQRRVLAQWPRSGALSTGHAAQLLAASLQAGRTYDWWYGDGHLYRVFLHAVFRGSPQAGNLVGWVALGHEVDRALAEQTRRLAGGEVVFSYGGEPVVSSLNAAAEAGFTHAHIAGREGLQQNVSLGGESYAVDSETLGAAPAPTLTVLRSTRPAQAFLSELNHLLLLVGLLALLVGAGLAYWIAGAFTRPLSALVAGARALAEGDYRFPLRPRGKDEAGQLTAAFARMRDSLEESQQRLLRSARMEAVGQLAGGIAHDFNNLITVINGFSDLLLMKLPPGDSQRRSLQQIRDAGDRAASLTRQLLLFSRKGDAHVQAVDVNAVLTGLHKMLAMLVGEHIELVLRPARELPSVEMDPTHLEQIIMNLAANARDAMPQGGVLTLATEACAAPPAGFSGAAAGRYVLLSVRDSGTGMDAATQRRIFEPFFTTKEVGRGTGLGLATVYGIVQRWHGYLHVDSAPGQGTCFRFLFPASGAVAAAAAAGEAATAPPTPVRARILLVEDETGLRAMVREVLIEEGYTVLEAGDGEAALELARQVREPLDLVLTDVAMPKLGGLAMAAALRRQHPNLPVIYTSGHTDATLTGQGLERQEVHFLAKPFAPATLLAKVREVLDPTSV